MSWLQNLLIKAQSNGLLVPPHQQIRNSVDQRVDDDAKLAMPRPQIIPARENGGSFAIKKGPFANVRRPSRSTTAEELDQQMLAAGLSGDINTFTTPPPVVPLTAPKSQFSTLGSSQNPPPINLQESPIASSGAPPPGSPMNPMSGNAYGNSANNPYATNNLGMILAQRRAMLQSNPGMYFNDYSLFDYGDWMDYPTYGMGFGGMGMGMGMGGYGMDPMTMLGVDAATDVVGGAVDFVEDLFDGNNPF